MTILQSGLAEDAGYKIQRSLRFRSSASAYLSRTPASASSSNIWTWSTWIKRGSLGSGQSVFNARDYTNSGNSYPFSSIYFTSTDQLGYDEAYNGAYVGRKITTQVFRDPSAWYHIVVALDTTLATSADRVKLYVNGNRITSFSTSVDPSGYTSVFSSNKLHFIGAGISAPSGSANAPFDGYLADTYFVSGQALTPSSFGQTDPVTGVWAPKKYTGTYGTNGFYLPFSDNTSATTLAYDKSGNGNNWTPNNISTIAGATYDSMTDVPTLTSSTAANFAVLNPLDQTLNGGSMGSGNLYLQGVASGSAASAYPTQKKITGKIYFELTSVSNGGYGRAAVVVTPFVYSALAAVTFGTGGTVTAYGTGGVAVDMDAGKMWVRNTSGAWLSGDPELDTSPSFTFTPQTDMTILLQADRSPGQAPGGMAHFNFGQRPFSYTPPTGFKALNTFNLPDPVIKKPNQYMDATTYTGNTTGQSIVNAGAFQPDLVWLKSRSNAYDNLLQDSVRGSTNYLISNSTASAATYAQGVTSFNGNGFTLGNDNGAFNANAATYVGWQWKKGATPGFDIVAYTGTGIAQNISHNLGVAPKMIIVKARNTTGDWQVYTSTTGQGDYLLLNSTAASAASSTKWNNTAPTSSVFSVGIDTTTNMATTTYVAYLFAEIPGFSKFGSYTGNGSTDGPFVFCGFRPKYVMVKRTDSTGSWCIVDASRAPYNATDKGLVADSSGAEGTGYTLDYLSNGFKIRLTGTAYNASGGTYIYAAFAENPFKYSLAR